MISFIIIVLLSSFLLCNCLLIVLFLLLFFLFPLQQKQNERILCSCYNTKTLVRTIITATDPSSRCLPQHHPIIHRVLNMVVIIVLLSSSYCHCHQRAMIHDPFLVLQYYSTVFGDAAQRNIRYTVLVEFTRTIKKGKINLHFKVKSDSHLVNNCQSCLKCRKKGCPGIKIRPMTMKIYR